MIDELQKIAKSKRQRSLVHWNSIRDHITQKRYWFSRFLVEIKEPIEWRPTEKKLTMNQTKSQQKSILVM